MEWITTSRNLHRNVQEGGPRYVSGRRYQQSWGEWDRENRKKLRVFVWVDGESILDNLVERHFRPHAEWRSVALEALEAEGVDPSTVRLNWSQRAGCTCPCSPGFIVTGLDGSKPLAGHSLHVHVVQEGTDLAVHAYVQAMQAEAAALRQQDRKVRELVGA